jgi:hypothetical protein
MLALEAAPACSRRRFVDGQPQFVSWNIEGGLQLPIQQGALTAGAAAHPR